MKPGRSRRIWSTMVFTLMLAAAIIPSGCSRSGESAGTAGGGRVSSSDGLGHDWGSINIRGGRQKHTFTLRNGGDTDLLLKGAFTSCACTEATIETADGYVSPAFAMNLPKDWSRTVKPGESFRVNVEFDPLYHGQDDTGPITRSVYLVTDARPDDRLSTSMPFIKDGSVTEFRVHGTVLSEEDFQKGARKDRYGISIGDIRLAEREFDFGLVKQSQDIVSHDFPFLYEGEVPLTITGTPTSCSCTRARTDSKRLEPGDEGTITVEFDPNLHQEPKGKFFRTIQLKTEPPLKMEVELRIWTEIDMDLGPDAYKQKDHKD